VDPYTPVLSINDYKNVPVVAMRQVSEVNGNLYYTNVNSEYDIFMAVNISTGGAHTDDDHIYVNKSSLVR